MSLFSGMADSSTEPHTVHRLYFCHALDGRGDVEHLFNRAAANMRLETAFREQYPEEYVLCFAMDAHRKGWCRTLEEAQAKRDRFLKEIALLPTMHPIREAQAAGRFHVLVGDQEWQALLATPDFAQKVRQGVVHQVSTPLPCGSQTPALEIQVSEFSVPGERESSYSARCLTAASLGFGPGARGVFLGRPQTLSHEEIAKKLSQAPDGALIAELFEKSPSPLTALPALCVITPEDVKDFLRDKEFLPMYTRDGFFVSKATKYVQQAAALLEGKKVTLLATGSTAPLEEKAGVLLSRPYVDSQTYEAISHLQSKLFGVCSGDNGFTQALSRGQIPLFERVANKRHHCEDFLRTVEQIPHSQEQHSIHSALVTWLSQIDPPWEQKQGAALPLTEEMVAHWKEVCVPWMYANRDYGLQVDWIEKNAIRLVNYLHSPGASDSVNDLSIALDCPIPYVPSIVGADQPLLVNKLSREAQRDLLYMAHAIPNDDIRPYVAGKILNQIINQSRAMDLSISSHPLFHDGEKIPEAFRRQHQTLVENMTGRNWDALASCATGPDSADAQLLSSLRSLDQQMAQGVMTAAPRPPSPSGVSAARPAGPTH